MILNHLYGIVPEFKSVVIPVPELQEGAEIRLREMDALSLAEFNDLIKKNRLLDAKKLPTFFASLVTLCAVDEEGNKISSIQEAGAIASSWGYDLLLKVGEAAAELNGFMGNSIDDTKKNLGKTPEKAQSGE